MGPRHKRSFAVELGQRREHVDQVTGLQLRMTGQGVEPLLVEEPGQHVGNVVGDCPVELWQAVPGQDVKIQARRYR